MVRSGPARTVLVVALVLGSAAALPAGALRADLPFHLTETEFWSLTETLSGLPDWERGMFCTFEFPSTCRRSIV